MAFRQRSPGRHRQLGANARFSFTIWKDMVHSERLGSFGGQSPRLNRATKVVWPYPSCRDWKPWAHAARFPDRASVTTKFRTVKILSVDHASVDDAFEVPEECKSYAAAQWSTYGARG